jgi:hypothetical protein
MDMSRIRDLRLRVFASALLAVVASAAISVGTALAGSGGPPIPR